MAKLNHNKTARENFRRAVKSVFCPLIERFPKNSTGLSSMADLAWKVYGAYPKAKMTRGYDDEGNYFLRVEGIGYSEFSELKFKGGYHEGRDSCWRGPSVEETEEIDQTYPRHKSFTVPRDTANDFERGLNMLRVGYSASSTFGGYWFSITCDSLKQIQNASSLFDGLTKQEVARATDPDIPSKAIPEREPSSSRRFKFW